MSKMLIFVSVLFICIVLLVVFFGVFGEVDCLDFWMSEVIVMVLMCFVRELIEFFLLGCN